MLHVSLQFAWVWLVLGIVSGMAMGLFFHKPEWLGGYDAWPRRMVRLGHIAFFGTGLLTLAFALTALHIGSRDTLADICAMLFIAGSIAMPTVCFLSAWRKPLRHLFAIPVISLLGGVGLFTWIVLTTPMTEGV
jgi:hypothetical protein